MQISFRYVVKIQWHSSVIRTFKIALAVCISQSEEIKQVWVTENKVRGHFVFFPQRLKFLSSEFGRFFRNGSALKKQTVYLLFQGTGTPALNPAHLGIEVSFKEIFKINYFP